MLPAHFGQFGAVCEEADFTAHGGDICGATMVQLEIIAHAFSLALTKVQALNADLEKHPSLTQPHSGLLAGEDREIQEAAGGQEGGSVLFPFHLSQADRDSVYNHPA